MEPSLSQQHSKSAAASTRASAMGALEDSNSRHSDSSWEDARDVNNYYGYGSTTVANNFPPLPPPLVDSNMTPERQQRKQRLRPCSRRGGACHSDLLKSAVLATLESYESGEEECFSGSATSIIGIGSEPVMDDNSRTSRKRARQRFDGQNEDSDSVDDCLLGAMDFCTISTGISNQPVRHVARRTSRELAFARSRAEHT